MRGKLPIKAQRARYIVVDWITTSIAFFIFNIIRFYILQYLHINPWETLESMCSDSKIIFEEIIVPIVLLVVYGLSGFYNEPFNKSRLSELSVTAASTSVNTALIYLLVLLNDIGAKRMDYLIILSLFVCLFVFTYVGRYLVTYATSKIMRKQNIGIRNLIIGSGEKAIAVKKALAESRTRIPNITVGFISIGEDKPAQELGTVWRMKMVKKICSEYNVDQIIIAPETHKEDRIMKIIDNIIPIGLPIKIAPDTLSYITANIRLGDILATPFVDLVSSRMAPFQKNIKRCFDILISVILLILLIPVYASVALIIKLTSPGPVIYKQERLGKNRKPFNIYKFRSMRFDAEKSGPQLSHNGDNRITPFGATMRKYRIDELPQFLNVLKGDMSLVGPRPEREFYVKKIIDSAPYYSLLFQVRPGITSWGMVKYGYASNVEQMVERSRYDLIYINNMSLATDIKILIYTIKPVITGAGI